MTRKTPTFADFDMFKTFADFDPAKATEQFAKMFQGFEMPTADIEAMMASQRKTLEAVNAANQAALEGVRTLSTRQAQIVRDAVADTQAAFDAIGKAKSPKDAVTKQTEIARKAYDKAVADLAGLRDLVNKTNVAASEPINTRIQESFDEVKAISEQLAK
ncbi:MAG: TIGR01841 family phasin [Rhodospirillales bacterium]